MSIVRELLSLDNTKNYLLLDDSLNLSDSAQGD